MIINQKSFKLNNKCFIEKFLIKPPHRYSTLAQDNACFIHLKHADAIVLSATEKLYLSQNDSALIKCGTFFTDFIGNLTDEPCEVYAVHLYPSILKEIYKADFPAAFKSNSEKKDMGKIKESFFLAQFIENLALYFEHPEVMNTDLLLIKMKEIILLLMQTSNAKTMASLFHDLYSPRYVTISEVLESHIHSALSTNELANLAGLSLSTFKREFKKQFQDTPSNYLKGQRLEKAKELLLATELSITEICFQVGFKDITHFSKSFKKRYKISPSSFSSLNRSATKLNLT